MRGRRLEGLLSPDWEWRGASARQMTYKEFDKALDEADPEGRRRAVTKPMPRVAEEVARIIREAEAVHDRLPDVTTDWRPLLAWLGSIGVAPAPTLSPFPVLTLPDTVIMLKTALQRINAIASVSIIQDRAVRDDAAATVAAITAGLAQIKVGA